MGQGWRRDAQLFTSTGEPAATWYQRYPENPETPEDSEDFGSHVVSRWSKNTEQFCMLHGVLRGDKAGGKGGRRRGQAAESSQFCKRLGFTDRKKPCGGFDMVCIESK